MTDFTSSPETEILPCPFCGSKPVTERTGFSLRAMYIYCINDNGCPRPKAIGETEEKAIENWNLRFDHAQCQQQWQPIGTAPKNRSVVGWCVFPAGAEDRIVRWFKDAFYAYGVRQDVTHWMERPRAPSDSSTDRGGK